MKALAPLLLLGGFTTLFSPSASAHTPIDLARRANSGLVPHVSPSTIDVSPNSTGAYPRLAALADGTVLATFADRTAPSADAPKVLRVARSDDGGHTFAALGAVARGTGNLDNPFLLQLADGSVLAAYRDHDPGRVYRIQTSRSRDGGRTWAFWSSVVERAVDPNRSNGVWEPFLRLSKKDGSLQVYYASENNATDQDILMHTSSDNGKTWSAPITAAGGTTTGRDGMPGCANFVADGAQKLMCVFETTEGTGNFSIKSVVSPDEGATWGNRSQVYMPADTAKNAGAPQIVQKSDGNLVVSFMTNEDATGPTPSDWTNAGVSFKIVTGPPVATGRWGHKTLVTGPQSLWPGLFAQKDGSVLACAGHASEGAVCHEVDFTSD